MKKRIIFYFIILQIFIVSFLFLQIGQKRGKVSRVSLNPISNNIIISSHSGNLNFFYEPKQNIVEEKSLDWMGKDYDYKVKYKINADTFNQVANYTVKKPKDTFRIVTLGDSFTFGENINTEDNYPSQLQNILNNSCSRKIQFQVLNLGVMGYDFQYSVNRFRLRGVKYQPDLVIWHIIGDDFQRINELLVPLESKYNKEMHLTGEYDKLIKQGNYYPAWSKARDEIITKMGGENELLRQNQRYIEEIYRYYNKKIVFSLLLNYPEKYTSILKIIAKLHTSTFIFGGITNIYQTNAFLPDYHPNKKGYKIIAEDTFNYLRDSKLIPCN